ncbi:hypothetical protein ACJX0J_020694, partial [Zea mays]
SELKDEPDEGKTIEESYLKISASSFYFFYFRLINFTDLATFSEKMMQNKLDEKREISDTERIRSSLAQGIFSEKGVVNAAIDKVVNTLLNEAAEKVLKEED